MAVVDASLGGGGMVGVERLLPGRALASWLRKVLLDEIAPIPKVLGRDNGLSLRELYTGLRVGLRMAELSFDET